MRSLQELLDKIHHHLDELIQISEKLRDVSKQVISREELDPLQKQQTALLNKLEKLDNELHEQYPSEMTEAIHESFHRKFVVFQELNKAFIENIRLSHGLIQFDFRQTKEEDTR